MSMNVTRSRGKDRGGAVDDWPVAGKWWHTGILTRKKKDVAEEASYCHTSRGRLEREEMELARSQNVWKQALQSSGPLLNSCRVLAYREQKGHKQSQTKI